MSWLKNKLPTLLLSLLFGVVAFFACGYWFIRQDLVLDNNITLQIDPINFLTFLIALYVLRKLQRETEESKAEKDLLISYFTSFESKFNTEIRKLINGNPIESTEVITILKEQSIVLQQLSQLSVQYYPKTEFGLNNLADELNTLRTLLTLTPAKGAVEDGVRVVGSRLEYSQDHLSQMNLSIGRFKMLLFAVITLINRD